MTSITDALWRFPSAQMAWRNLGRNRVRTALAALGIVIGVLAIASLGIAGAALQYQATSDLASLADEVTVYPGEDLDTLGLTNNQVNDIRAVAGDADVIPQKSDRTSLTARNGQEAFVSVTALTRASTMYDVSRGESPERLRSGALLSASTATLLELDLGDPVEYDGQLYRIRGLIEADQGFGSGPGGGGDLVLPESAAADQGHYDVVTILADDGDAAVGIVAGIEERFNEPDHQAVNVNSFASAQDEIGSFMSTLNLALMGIGSISLVVASVAILNVMLMSTIERRGEIGVLRAVGIRRGEVLRMILAEAAFLGLLGGIVGAGVSLVVGFLIFDALVGDPFLVLGWESAKFVLYGLAFAVVAGVLSGLYPAWKAANDRPVEALRG